MGRPARSSGPTATPARSPGDPASRPRSRSAPTASASSSVAPRRGRPGSAASPRWPTTPPAPDCGSPATPTRRCRGGYGPEIALSPDGERVFTSGPALTGVSGDWDFRTAAYDAASGAQLWVKGYDGPVDAA